MAGAQRVFHPAAFHQRFGEQVMGFVVFRMRFQQRLHGGGGARGRTGGGPEAGQAQRRKDRIIHFRRGVIQMADGFVQPAFGFIHFGEDQARFGRMSFAVQNASGQRPGFIAAAQGDCGARLAQAPGEGRGGAGLFNRDLERLIGFAGLIEFNGGFADLGEYSGGRGRRERNRLAEVGERICGDRRRAPEPAPRRN